MLLKNLLFLKKQSILKNENNKNSNSLLKTIKTMKITNQNPSFFLIATIKNNTKLIKKVNISQIYNYIAFKRNK